LGIVSKLCEFDAPSVIGFYLSPGAGNITGSLSNMTPGTCFSHGASNLQRLVSCFFSRLHAEANWSPGILENVSLVLKTKGVVKRELTFTLT